MFIVTIRDNSGMKVEGQGAQSFCRMEFPDNSRSSWSNLQKVQVKITLFSSWNVASGMHVVLISKAKYRYGNNTGLTLIGLGGGGLNSAPKQLKRLN